MLLFLLVSVVPDFIFLLKLLSPKHDQEYSQLLMEDDCFDILCQISYRGLATKE